jgi:hypothetical protein
MREWRKKKGKIESNITAYLPAPSRIKFVSLKLNTHAIDQQIREQQRTPNSLVPNTKVESFISRATIGG